MLCSRNLMGLESCPEQVKRILGFWWHPYTDSSLYLPLEESCFCAKKATNPSGGVAVSI